MQQHPTAVVHPEARLAPTVRVGPYAVIDAGVELGPGCIVGPHAYLTGVTIAGENNLFFAGCVIGESPQDLKYKGQPTRLRIGSNNVFREHVTVHRSNKLEEDTVIGSGCLLMAGCHVAHNCQLSDNVIIANAAQMGGHVTIGERAFISGNCLIHQFVRVGTLALMQGGSAISRDLPPYTIARGGNGTCGLNTVGLRRAGFTAAERLELKELYRCLFLRPGSLKEAVAVARGRFKSLPAQHLIDFVASSSRGVCEHTGAAFGEQAGEALTTDAGI